MRGTSQPSRGFQHWAAVGTFYGDGRWPCRDSMRRGWPDAPGLGGLAGHRGESWRPLILALLAEAYGKAGQAAEGLRVLAEALTLSDKHGGAYMYEAELHRLQGELLRRRLVTDAATQAEACFQQALAIARRQQAKSWELRAATSLSRLWQQQGKRATPEGSWHRSTAGSPRGLTPETYKRPKRSCMIWGVPG